MRADAKAFKKLFPQQHIPSILTSLFQAGETLRKRAENDREDWITRRLYRRLVIIPTFRDGPLGIHLKPEIISTELDLDTHTGEIDLFVSCALGYEVYFPIEAKRLRFLSSEGKVIPGSAAYVSDGMMRFITGQYSPYMQAAAMLGYVFDVKIDVARSDIDKAVRKKAMELKLKFPEQLSRSSILPDNPVDETHHDLEERPFIIYHVFLHI
ncbi:MAG: hypothetical protein Q8O38_16730 [Sulfurimicrobium sp.]|nr:hypothetical protein [Sulfurimicrobium sp.]